MLRFVAHVFVSNEGLKTCSVALVGAERVSVVFDYVDPDKFSGDRMDAGKVEELRQRLQGRTASD